MNCTRCHKEISEGKTVYVAPEYPGVFDYSCERDLPFCSYECLGRYFCNYEEQVSKELIDFCDKADDKDEALHEWIYG